MIIAGILISVLMLLFGVFIKYFKCYWLFSGYNLLSKEKKKKVDVDGLCSFVGNYVFIMAGLLFIGNFLYFSGIEAGLVFSLGLIAFIAVYITTSTRKFIRE